MTFPKQLKAALASGKVETFADDLANLGADIIHIYMSRAVWLYWVLIHFAGRKALAGKAASATATCDTGCAAAAGGTPCAIATGGAKRERQPSNLNRLRRASHISRRGQM